MFNTPIFDPICLEGKSVTEIFKMFPAVEFSHNWNLKLCCNVFTTIRIAQPKKYIKGNLYSISFKGQFRGIARIELISKFKLDKLTEGAAMIDTGYSLEETLKVISKMYKNAEEQDFYLIFLRYVHQVNKNIFY